MEATTTGISRMTKPKIMPQRRILYWNDKFLLTAIFCFVPVTCLTSIIFLLSLSWRNICRKRHSSLHWIISKDCAPPNYCSKSKSWDGRATKPGISLFLFEKSVKEDRDQERDLDYVPLFCSADLVLKEQNLDVESNPLK